MSREIARIIEEMEDRHERVERRLLVAVLVGSLTLNALLIAAAMAEGAWLR